MVVRRRQVCGAVEFESIERRREVTDNQEKVDIRALIDRLIDHAIVQGVIHAAMDDGKHCASNGAQCQLENDLREAAFILEQLATIEQAVIKHDDRAAEFRRRIDTAIADLVVDEGQKPISEGAIQAAERFVKGMPVYARMPDVSVDPDGAISLDWGNGASNLLSININGSDRIIFVWRDG